jgi:hypothetical protein
MEAIAELEQRSNGTGPLTTDEREQLRHEYSVGDERVLRLLEQLANCEARLLQHVERCEALEARLTRSPSACIANADRIRRSLRT